VRTEKIDDLPAYLKVTKQKLNGIVYTPEWIVNVILNKVSYKRDLITKKIIDPACGDGNFLIPVVQRLLHYCIRNKIESEKIKEILRNNIYGFDIDSKAISECITNLHRITSNYNINNVDWNILCIDSLDKTDVKRYFDFFDFVVGNPPYIRIQHLGEKRRKKIQEQWSFCKSGSTDIYIAFFELGIHLLKNNGKLGYITPNTYFKTDTAKLLRFYLINKKMIAEIIDFNHHQVFENATTYSAITILSKKGNINKFRYSKGYNKKIDFVDNILLTNLGRDKWTLASNNELNKIKEIEKRGVPLGKIAKIHVGVTTLADNFYIFKDPIIYDKNAIIKLKDGRTFQIEKDVLRPIVKVSVLKTADEEQNRYIIFPYKKINNKHVLINEAEFKQKYPQTYNYFLKIKDRLALRDKGNKIPVAWYAFGRTQALDTSWGKKILVAPMSLEPNFIVWEKEEYTFYAGYCIKYDGDLHWLAKQLNSDDMKMYINFVARDYQHGYKSYAKSFLVNYGITGYKSKGQKALNLFI
jgi:adenine-specific DNA-methyltransferase